MRAAFYTLGCKVNQYETQILAQQFSADGFDIVDHRDEADVYVVNSCTVTSASDKKTRQIIHRLRRQNPSAKIALTGCFPQAFPKDAEILSDADVVTGSYNRKDVLASVKESLATGKRIVNITPHKRDEAFEPMRAKNFSERTRAFVKIEDGCDRYCSYCIIPTSRGPVRSKPMDELKAELKELAEAGYSEIVLVGINLSSYGRELGLRLVDAVEAACHTEGVKRVRLGSLEPELLTQDDIDRMAALPQFCPQFHLSLQSGCDATLKRMNRHYDGKEYMRIVEMIRKAFDNSAITTDIMVGFPGETDEEFKQSLEFAEKLGLAKAHVFAYSRRAGTRADKMDNQITRAVKEERSAKMIEVTDITRKAFYEKQVGLVEEVLFETLDRDNMYEGYTKNYTPVRVKSDCDLSGKTLSVKITQANDDFCLGEIE